MDWQLLGTPAPDRLRRAREQAHWAAQVIAAVGETFLRHVPDTSHTAMGWEAAREALVGHPIPGARPCRLALRMADLTLLLLGEAGSSPAGELHLAGRTLSEADGWAADAVRRTARGEPDRALVHPEYELPPHALATGGRFEPDPGLPELARWYANADGVLRRLERETPGAGPVLCWPHHFDIATLIAVESDRNGNAVRTVGVGLSPGDDSIGQPYWYVNHGPATERATLPPLAAGEWFTEGWVGAVLRGDALVAAGGAGAQEARLRRYLDSAVSASRELALEGRLT